MGVQWGVCCRVYIGNECIRRMAEFGWNGEMCVMLLFEAYRGKKLRRGNKK